MLQLILDPTRLLILLILLAVATPVAAWLLRHRLPGVRLSLVLGASGPAILALWGIHNLVLETIGFASVWSALLLLVLAVAIGIGAGWWLAGDREPQTSTPPKRMTRP